MSDLNLDLKEQNGVSVNVKDGFIVVTNTALKDAKEYKREIDSALKAEIESLKKSNSDKEFFAAVYELVTEMKFKSAGGYRHGANPGGRKRKDEAKKSKKHTVRLSDLDIEKFHNLGGIKFIRSKLASDNNGTSEMKSNTKNEALKNHSISFYDDEWVKVKKLGGAKWIRHQIQAAK